LDPVLAGVFAVFCFALGKVFSLKSVTAVFFFAAGALAVTLPSALLNFSAYAVAPSLTGFSALLVLWLHEFLYALIVGALAFMAGSYLLGKSGGNG
jgi:hypothetical protein